MEKPDYFDTERLRSGLRDRSFRGATIVLASQTASFCLSLLTTVVLARLLTPEDFGLVAMVTSFTALFFLLRELGLSTATVQRAQITHEQISVLFWINAAAGLLMAVLVIALASPISWFYGIPQLKRIVLLVSLGLPLGGLTVQHEALLQRQMKYGTLAVIELAAATSGAAFGIVLAWKGAGVWALVMIPLVTSVATLAGTWLACDWRPGLPARGSGVRPMVDFGSHVAAFAVINYLARNLDNVLIGRFLGAGPLGQYSRAYALLMFPLSRLNTPLSAVAVPALSRLVGEPERYRRAYCEAVESIQMVSVPATAFLIVSADWVILVALGSQWHAAAGIYAFLGLAGLVQPLASSTGWLFTSQGRVSEMSRWGLIGGVLSITSFIVGLPWGAAGVAAAYGGTGLAVRAPLLFWYVSRNGPVRQRDLYRTLSLPLAAGCAVACAVYGLRLLTHIHQPILGLAASAVVALAAIALVYGLHERGRARVAGALSGVRGFMMQRSASGA
jgi:O-antigen/teichoic acid export membrane protein